MKIEKLDRLLTECWIRNTSSEPENWTHKNPAWGQCAVTALIVQDYLGGRIIWAPVRVGDRELSHYFNLIEGEEVDLTRKQFPEGTFVPKGVDKAKGFPTTRDYILSFNETKKRYMLLRGCIESKVD